MLLCLPFMYISRFNARLSLDLLTLSLCSDFSVLLPDNLSSFHILHSSFLSLSLARRSCLQASCCFHLIFWCWDGPFVNLEEVVLENYTRLLDTYTLLSRGVHHEIPSDGFLKVFLLKCRAVTSFLPYSHLLGFWTIPWSLWQGYLWSSHSWWVLPYLGE